MDRREKSGDFGAALLAFGEGLQASLWTALPCILQSFDPATQTCTAQPAIQAQYTGPDGVAQWVTLPTLLDVPVVFPGGASGGLLTFPLQPGDEGLVVFASRCIDAWWDLGGVQVQAELRMHDLSDGFFIPGGSSRPAVAPSIDPTYIELRSQDGAAKVRIHPTTHDVQVSTTGNATVAATRIDINGSLFINGEAYVAHKHTGVTVGTGQTGGKA